MNFETLFSPESGAICQPHPELEVTWVRNVRIPMPDGVQLAADLCLPMAAAPLPVVVEYMPYRKDEAVPGGRYSERLARRGYIIARVDPRGTGASQGVTTDEYLPVEQQDGYHLVEWIAGQPWCDGHVAMMGISYGGFTALQVAALRPPHLTAIVPVNFTDDRYTDDCHYAGGLLRMYYDPAFYGSMMVAYNALPSAWSWNEADWAHTWQEHLDGSRPYLLEWLRHPTDGTYWRNGSVGQAADEIQCPVFLVGGWRDGYPNPPLRLYQALKSPRKVLIGPWNHAWPDKAIPGPRLDFVHEVARWLDYWCKGIDTGVMAEPPVQVFVQEYTPPDPERLECAGRWRGEPDYPLPDTRRVTVWLGPSGTLAGSPGLPGQDSLPYQPAAGLQGGLWSGGLPFGLPGDQRADEALGLVYTGQPLDAPLVILGRPSVSLHVMCDAPVVAYVASLCDVAPDGTSVLVAKGRLNATRRASLTDPEPLPLQEPVALQFEIDCTAYQFNPGHRIRLSLACADFPNLWPTPYPARNRLLRGGVQASHLVLPVVPAAGRAQPPAFLPSPRQVGPPSGLRPAPVWQVEQDQLTGRTTVRIGWRSESAIDDRTRAVHDLSGAFTVTPVDPAHASAEGCYTSTFSQGGQDVQAEARVRLESDLEAFHLAIHLEVRRDGRPVFQKSWVETYPRQLL